MDTLIFFFLFFLHFLFVSFVSRKILCCWCYCHCCWIYRYLLFENFFVRQCSNFTLQMENILDAVCYSRWWQLENDFFVLLFEIVVGIADAPGARNNMHVVQHVVVGWMDGSWFMVSSWVAGIVLFVGVLSSTMRWPQLVLCDSTRSGFRGVDSRRL